MNKWKRTGKIATSYRYGDTSLTVDINEYATCGSDAWIAYYHSDKITMRPTRMMAQLAAESWYRRTHLKGE